jgi:hypothetical protein
MLNLSFRFFFLFEKCLFSFQNVLFHTHQFGFSLLNEISNQCEELWRCLLGSFRVVKLWMKCTLRICSSLSRNSFNWLKSCFRGSSGCFELRRSFDCCFKNNKKWVRFVRCVIVCVCVLWLCSHFWQGGCTFESLFQFFVRILFWWRHIRFVSIRFVFDKLRKTTNELFDWSFGFLHNFKEPNESHFKQWKITKNIINIIIQSTGKKKSTKEKC